ncbi:MAG: hypothetical protein IE937_11695 [Gammaproteobacteria bacterium]|nr:hypothetical protein [Gammaproteobacteria bacterium]MBD3777463.1 hypothetical protein [Thiotrichales bacterium]
MNGFTCKNNTLKPIMAGLILGMASLISSCALTPPKSLMDIQAGEHFVLKQPITIPAGKARQTIQFGQLSGSGFNQTEQHCRIEIYALQTQNTIIQPQSFTIKSVQLGEEMIAQRADGKLFAANDLGLSSQTQTDVVRLADMGYERPETMDLVHLYLHSDTQPNVYRLTCAGALSNGDPKDAPRSYRPKREQINRILGAVGSIEP